MFDDIPLTSTPEEAGHLLHIGRNSIYRLIDDGQIQVIRLGRKTLIPRNALVDFLTTFGKGN